MTKHAAYMRDWLARNPGKKAAAYKKWMAYAGSHKKKLIEIINRAKAHPCADCGIQYNPWVMDFDHRNPADKLDSVSRMAVDGKSVDVIEAEILKCDVVCSNCHRERTHRQGINKEI